MNQHKFDVVHRHLDLGPDLYRVQEKINETSSLNVFQKFQILEKIDKKTKRPVKLPNGADAIEVDMQGKFGPMMDSLHEELSSRRVPTPIRFWS